MFRWLCRSPGSVRVASRQLRAPPLTAAPATLWLLSPASDRPALRRSDHETLASGGSAAAEAWLSSASASSSRRRGRGRRRRLSAVGCRLSAVVFTALLSRSRLFASLQGASAAALRFSQSLAPGTSTRSVDISADVRVSDVLSVSLFSALFPCSSSFFPAAGGRAVPSCSPRSSSDLNPASLGSSLAHLSAPPHICFFLSIPLFIHYTTPPRLFLSPPNAPFTSLMHCSPPKPRCAPSRQCRRPFSWRSQPASARARAASMTTTLPPSFSFLPFSFSSSRVAFFPSSEPPSPPPCSHTAAARIATSAHRVAPWRCVSSSSGLALFLRLLSLFSFLPLLLPPCLTRPRWFSRPLAGAGPKMSEAYSFVPL